MAAAAALITACRAPADETRPDVLRLVSQFRFEAPDPHATDHAATLDVLRNVHETLADFDDDGGIAPRLAASWTNPNDLTWRFELRPDVRFHDGSALTAEDVKASIDRGLAAPGSWIRSTIPLLERVTVAGPLTVEMTTRKPAPLLLNQLSSVMIVPRRATGAPFAGTGPYRIESWSPEDVRLSRFEGYRVKAPRWERAEYRYVADADARVRAVMTGAADAAEAPPVGSTGWLADERVQVVRLRAPRVAILGFSVEDGRSPFRDARVRRAVAVSLDRRRLVAESQHGWGEPLAQLAPPGVFGALSDVPVPAADPEEAKALLRAAGHAEVAGPLHYATERSGALAGAIARQAAAAGVRLEPEHRDSSVFDRMLMERRTPAYVFVMTFPNRDTSDLLAWGLHSPRPDRGYGVLNFAGLSDPELDRLIQESEAELRPLRRSRLLQDAMRAALETHAWVPLCTLDAIYAVRQGLQWGRTGTGRVSVEDIRAPGPAPAR